MQIINGVVRLGKARQISHLSGDVISFKDETGTQFVIPLSTVIRLYGIAQFEAERAGQDWELQCKALIAA